MANLIYVTPQKVLLHNPSLIETNKMESIQFTCKIVLRKYTERIFFFPIAREFRSLNGNVWLLIYNRQKRIFLHMGHNCFMGLIPT